MRDADQTPVISGIGMISGLGIGKEKNWESMINGQSCITRLKNLPNKIGGPLPEDFAKVSKDILPRRFFKRSADFVHLGLVTSILALEDALVDVQQIDLERAGVVIGNCVGGLRYMESLLNQKKAGEDVEDVLAFESTAAAKFMQNALSAQIALIHGFEGPNMVVSTACSSGNYALSVAADLVRAKKCDVVIAGGCEIFVTEFCITSFTNIGAMTDFSGDPKRAIKPFDKYRSGTVVSDGSALMLVESLAHAKKRNVAPYCKIAGSSMTCEAYDIVNPHPQGTRMAKTMSAAIADAKIPADDINHIQAHGTGTISNDVAETKAIKEVFGENAYKDLPITSIKSMIGHTIGAAGAFSVAVAALAYKNNLIPGTINLEHYDPDCDLDYVSDGSRQINLKYTLCNSFALGGHNSCIVLGP